MIAKCALGGQPVCPCGQEVKYELRVMWRKEKEEEGEEEVKSGEKMDKYRCLVCGYIYDPVVGDPDNGQPAGTKFSDLPDSWVCPECGVGKDQFEKVV